MAKVIAVGAPRNESERQAIAYLRDHLPVNCTIIHNFELTQSKESFEVDLAVLTPYCVYVVDVKGVQGLVDIYGAKWHPEGREPYNSPLMKARMNARLLKAFITDSFPANLELHKVYVRAAILLTAANVRIDDHNNNTDSDDIVRLNKSTLYFQNKANVPSNYSIDIRNVLPLIEKTITGKARKPQVLTYREWQVEEKLGGNEHYTEYRARHLFTGKHGTARLRVYRADPYQDEATRKREQKLISNAYRTISDVPGHPNILNVKDFFPAEDGSYFVLVTEDAHGQALRQHMKKASLALTFDQKLNIIRDVLTALEHAHTHQVVHRNLTPDTILVSADGHARLSSFEYARAGSSATSTIANDIVEDIDQNYQAPECYGDPSQASAVSDLFSAGLVFYELLTGETAFSDPTQMYDAGALFPVKPTDVKPDLPPGLNEWLQKLCAFEPYSRFPDATSALNALQQAITPVQKGQPEGQIVKRSTAPLQSQDKKNLPREYVLGERFVVQERLGQGGFAVAYKVFDTLAEVMRVLKLVLTDHISVYQRLRQEYKTLISIPEHPYVVKVIWADRLADGTPYMVFEYVDGLDVDKLVHEKALSVEDAVKLAQQVAEGLIFLHTHGVYHQDIKPSNLLWTDEGVRIIDFNVSRSDQDSSNMLGGTGRYIPPDLVGAGGMTTSQKIERDVYALGVTLYECVTGHYPFEDTNIRKNASDPYTFEGCDDLHPALVSLLLKAIAPHSSERFATPHMFLSALHSLPAFRKPIEVPEVTVLNETIEKPNYNPYVHHLLTLYSQSQYTNAGTRGLDTFSEQIYVETLLDKQLRPAILHGDFRLVIISGNAGDGKTAFIQQMAKDAEQQGAVIEQQVNGYTFHLHGRTFLSNYDGSQDEGEKTNDEVLLTFLTPFMGIDEQAWSNHETRLIAINEGRLVDFLTEYQQRFPRLVELVRAGLNGQALAGSIAVINLNLRSVVADQQEGESAREGARGGVQEEQNNSIFDRLVRRMTAKQFWEVCESCDLKQSCYAYHNARTFMDPVAGSRTIERLKTLYTITHLRGQLHITLRDLRSSLAYMLVGTRDCDEIHNLYREGTPQSLQQIFDGFYFNAWMGGAISSKDRLIALLREIDVGEASNPNLDRGFDFLGPASRSMARFNYVGRNSYDDDLLERQFKQLPREYVGKARAKNIELHKNYVAMLRRRHYFECRDDSWQEMLPYNYYEDFYRLITRAVDSSSQVQALLQSINRGEGLTDATGLQDALALRVRRVERGTIQSYRLFNRESFTLTSRETQESIRFVEHLAQFLTLSYSSETGHIAELRIYLDMYEMLMRLQNGYRPSPEELQGFYLSLMIFKNVLTSAPYQEVLLTETGHEFYKVSRRSDGTLSLTQQQYNR